MNFIETVIISGWCKDVPTIIYIQMLIYDCSFCHPPCYDNKKRL
nr:MAG TPA: hypothetical protein [Bacteriophage sp.]